MPEQNQNLTQAAEKLQWTNLVPVGLSPNNPRTTEEINDSIIKWCEDHDVLCIIQPTRAGKPSDGTYRESPYAYPEFFVKGFGVIDGYIAFQTAYANVGWDKYQDIQKDIFTAMDNVDAAKNTGDRQAEQEAKSLLRDLQDQIQSYAKPIADARDLVSKAVSEKVKAAMSVPHRSVEEVEVLHQQYLVDICAGTEDTSRYSMLNAAIRQNETDHKNLVRRRISRIVRNSKAQAKDALTTRLMQITDQVMEASGSGDLEQVQALSQEMQSIKGQLLALG